MNIKRLTTFTLGTALLLGLPVLLRAQQDQDNVVEAAKKAQAEKQSAPKPKMVIDNDNLGTLTGTVSVVGQEPPGPDDKAKEAAPAEKAPVKDEAYWRQQFAGANKKLTDDEHELDIMQREYNLKQEQFYTDPMAALTQDYSRQDLNDAKQKIDDMTAVVAQDKQGLSDLEDALRQAGGDPGWATPPSTQTDNSAPSTPSDNSPAAPPAAAPATPPAAVPSTATSTQ